MKYKEEYICDYYATYCYNLASCVALDLYVQ
jgi:hypothetical protein